MTRTEKRQQESLTYHLKAIVKIICTFIVKWFNRGADWLQGVFDKVEAYQIKRMKAKVQAYDARK